MFDAQWTQYKTMMRRKYRKSQKKLAELEIVIKWFESQGEKFDFKKLAQFAKDKGSRMSKEEKDKIAADTEAEMKKQG